MTLSLLPTELLNHVAIFVPPHELHRVGQLNRRCRYSSHFLSLATRPSFASRNLKYHILVQRVIHPYQLTHIPFTRLGVHYITVLVEVFGFTSKTLSILHPNNVNTINWLHLPYFYTPSVTWSDIMPDIFPDPTATLISHSLQLIFTNAATASIQLNTTKHDPLLILLWSAHAGNTNLARCAIPAVVSKNATTPVELMYHFRSAFFFAYHSNSADMMQIVLDSGYVEVEEYAGQALAESALLGLVESVRYLLGRRELEWVVDEGLKEAVGVAVLWARQNRRNEVLAVLEGAKRRGVVMY
ncbi:hypothetical protein BCR33DRAFT_713503 [Rhizoclosmatium globosum]|uniref:F-box domain-containing protein n=1 Tax=Rhizoclosmatium globosum TaxID=329046 RepID=A0A1Y2CS80_9FUNG|nr:hypothetical protein BCR33DRAFT_713503 [Rhizoclosmatium globosum]|eukprot:ORY49899.1 hypothetical protein BCR33DRAFT_713503 [Rhizoclosmatium globosum]